MSSFYVLLKSDTLLDNNVKMLTTVKAKDYAKEKVLRDPRICVSCIFFFFSLYHFDCLVNVLVIEETKDQFL